MIKAVILDLDGTIWYEDALAPGSGDLVDFLCQSEIPYAFLTNTTSNTPEFLARKANSLGIVSEEWRFFTAVSHLNDHIKRNFQRQAKFVITGEDDVLLNQMLDFGYDAVSLEGKDEEPSWANEVYDQECVVLISAFNRNFGYSQISTIFNIRKQIHEYWVIGNDVWYGAKGRAKVAASWITASIEEVIGKKHQGFGKPNAGAVEMVCRMLKVDSRDTLIVGDSPASDIAAAKNAGAKSCLISDSFHVAPDGSFFVNRVDQVIDIIKRA